MSAGQIIEEVGLKGYQIGGAEVSAIHGNFIVNKGKATSNDVILLIKSVRDCVKKKRNIILEPEVVLLGKSWDQVL